MAAQSRPGTACGQPASQDHPNMGHLGRHAATGPCHRFSLQALAAPFTGTQLAWVQARCRTYADGKEISFMQCARSLEPTMHTACAAAAAAEHRTQTSGPCRAPRYERDQVPCRRRRPVQRQRGRGPPSLSCSSPSRLRARRSRAHRSRRRRASRVAEHPADRIRRGTAKQAGRVRRRRGQPDLGTDHRKLGNVWRTAESNYGSSPYHLGATWSIEVAGAGQRTFTVA
jgi:hypothetical protein